MLTFEFEPPVESACRCCGRTATSLTRFVYRDDDAYSIYYATFTEGHPDRVALATISLGSWSDESTPAQRVAFALELRSAPSQHELRLLDAAQSPWCNATVIGRTLDREEALAHPRLREVYDLVDEIVVQDEILRDYLEFG